MIRDETTLAAMRARAIELVGVPWRLLGRDANDGLDCIGVLLEVYKAGGYQLPDLDPLGIHATPESVALWQCFDPCPTGEHGLWGDVALWPVQDDGTKWSAHVAVLFGNQLVTANEAKGVHALDYRRHLTALAKMGQPPPRWFRLKEELA